MTLAPNTFEGNTVLLALTMLSNSLTAQTMVGAVDAPGCQACIINRYGGNPREAGAPGKTINMLGNQIARPSSYFLVDAEDWPEEMIAMREYKHNGTILIVGITALLTNELPPDMMTRGRNLMGGIKADMLAQLGQSGCLMSADFHTHGPSHPDITGAHKNTIEFLIEIHWRDYI